MRIDYHNLKESQLDLAEALREELEALNDLSEAFDEFVSMESFQGETADSMRSYILEIQKPIINGIIARTQGLDAVNNPPRKTTTKASQGLVWMICSAFSRREEKIATFFSRP